MMKNYQRKLWAKQKGIYSNAMEHNKYILVYIY